MMFSISHMNYEVTVSLFYKNNACSHFSFSVIVEFCTSVKFWLRRAELIFFFFQDESKSGNSLMSIILTSPFMWIISE